MNLVVRAFMGLFFILDGGVTWGKSTTNILSLAIR